MSKIFLENEIQAIGLKLNYFNVDKLFLQLEHLNQKIKKVGDMPNLKKYEPTFLLEQSCDHNVRQ